MEQTFVPSDIGYNHSINEENLTDSQIKTEEEIKDEDILLFSQLEQFRDTVDGDSSFQVLQENEDSSFTFPDSLGNSDFHSFLQNNFNNDKLDNVKVEATSHYVKYKKLDGKQVKVWSCGICSKEFGHQYTLMRHLPTHTDERNFQCITCGKAFRQMSTLSQHRAIHSSERPYVCEVCHKTFNRVSTLISHRKTHTGLKPHRCHLCNKAFHQKGNLRNHVFTHTNERPYKCDVCEKGFNQMSNLMCHKIKAHQRADKPKYVCRICSQDFPKRVALRNHEQYQHGLNQTVDITPTPEKMKYSNAIIVDPIKTEAMKLAVESSQTPFALLRPLTGIPVLVRVVPAGEKQMLIPATAEDLKKHGQISITPKVTADGTDADKNKENPTSFKLNGNGSTVQIKIPVVATVIQQSGRDGLSMSVVSPGPNGEILDKNEKDGGGNSFVYTSTLTDLSSNFNGLPREGAEWVGPNENKDDDSMEKIDALKEAVQMVHKVLNLDDEKNATVDFIPPEISHDTQIEFLDDTGNIIPEEEFQRNFNFPDDAVLYNSGDVVLIEPPLEGASQNLINEAVKTKSVMNELNNFLLPNGAEPNLNNSANTIKFL